MASEMLEAFPASIILINEAKRSSVIRSLPIKGSYSLAIFKVKALIISSVSLISSLILLYSSFKLDIFSSYCLLISAAIT